jgi:hypothetical protein
MCRNSHGIAQESVGYKAVHLHLLYQFEYVGWQTGLQAAAAASLIA